MPRESGPTTTASSRISRSPRRRRLTYRLRSRPLENQNETFNVLKTDGYNLEHNFGHGTDSLASILVTLNLLAFAFHSAAYLAVLTWRAAGPLATRCGSKLASRSRGMSSGTGCCGCRLLRPCSPDGAPSPRSAPSWADQADLADQTPPSGPNQPAAGLVQHQGSQASCGGASGGLSRRLWPLAHEIPDGPFYPGYVGFL
jgi:hypothetical protein